jgi:ATP-dependent Lhr-like helicase
MTEDPNRFRHLEWAHPLVRDWFLAKFGSATEPQEQGWPHILAGRSTLISAPTGSGKTLAAFLACIDSLVRKAVSGQLQDETAVIYVSPLKALSNDIQKNLDSPLAEIRELAAARGIPMAEIRTAVRTGDTLAGERQAMLKRPPHILVTTPESLYILLTAEKSREMLQWVRTIIVDEIHAIADDKRGSHLSLTLERLDLLCAAPPNRVGLSATQNPIELVGQFLSGSGPEKPFIVNVGRRRRFDLAIEVPAQPLEPVASDDLWEETFDRLATLVQEHRSTLIFVNTRKQAERVAMHLAERLGEDAVACHHGSLSRQIRLAAERRLKNGEVKVLVATASLELGIDIGFIDLVCQISNCKSIAAALQRIGRAGHWRGAVPKGRLFPHTRDELVESAALVHAIRQGAMDKVQIPECPLDILAQQIVAMTAVQDWTEDTLFEIVKRAYPYRNLSRHDFDAVIHMLAEGISARRGRYGAYLMRDQVNGEVHARRGARLAAITSGGAIPETNLYAVVAQPEGTSIGTLDEDFAMESHRGDIILLGNTSWRISTIDNRTGKVFVADAHGASPTVPFWFGEAPARTNELSHYLSELRAKLDAGTKNVPLDFKDLSEPTDEVRDTIAWLRADCGVDESAASQIIEYIVQGRAVLGAVPTEKQIVVERFFDEGGGMQMVIHAPFGGRINRAWGLAMRKKLCRTFNCELQAAATEDGLTIALAEGHSFPLGDVFYYLTAATVKETLEQSALQSPVFATRWKWDAMRSLALLRFMGGKKVPPILQRIRSDDLLSTVFPQAGACQNSISDDVEIPDHPLVNEVMKDVLTEAMDLKGLEEVLNKIGSGEIKCLAVDTPTPSQFSAEILNANVYAYLDDAPLEERRARAVEMRRVLPNSVLQQVGQLDPLAIQQVKDESWPDLRNADELHDLMQSIVVMPEDASSLGFSPKSVWLPDFESLKDAQRATRIFVGGKTYWVNTERVEQAKLIWPEATFESAVPRIETAIVDRGQAILPAVRGWLSVLGPVRPADLVQLLSLEERDVDIALLSVEAEGFVLRGQFTSLNLHQVTGLSTMSCSAFEWCERRLLARIHKLTIATLRKQIEPVSAALYVRWLANWQHLAPGTQLVGEQGVLEVIRQLQGYEIPASAWEPQVLARRIKNYSFDLLDRLCMRGTVGWGRLSLHPVLAGSAEAAPKKLAPKKAAFLRHLKRPDRKKEVSKSEDMPAISASDSGTLSGETSKAPPGGIIYVASSIRRIIPTSSAPIAFFVREDADWMSVLQKSSPSADLSRLSSTAQAVENFLKQRGASFFADIQRGTNMLNSDVENGLWELVTAGLVSADGFDNLRALIDPKRRSGQGGPRASNARETYGRWSLLYAERSIPLAKAMESLCRVLLRRYGVVFRDVVQRESNLPSWRELLAGFRVLEDRGEIRGGRFISGFIGEQFALPEALESLRAARNRETEAGVVSASATDPLNLIGVILPGEKVPAIPGKLVQISV